MAKKVIITFALILGYLLFWPVPITPVAWHAPENFGYQNELAKNDILSQVQRIELINNIGPEDFAVDQQNNLYFSLSNGDINYLDSQGNIHHWVNTGGRPLGIEFDSQGNLIVADAFIGLLKISADKEITTLLTKVAGKKIIYADDVDVADNGQIYLTDASTKFSAKKYGTYGASLVDINEHGGHGRVIEYNPATKQASILADGLNFANGISISHDQQSVLVNETGHYRILKIALFGENRGKQAVLVDNLPSFPDNINRGSNGMYWLGLISPRSKALDTLSNQTFLRKIVQRLPLFLRPKAQNYGHIIAINDLGEITANLQDPSGIFNKTTGAVEIGDSLYISSLHETAIAKIKNPLMAEHSQQSSTAVNNITNTVNLAHTDGFGLATKLPPLSTDETKRLFATNQQLCDSQCVTPFGTELGIADGAIAYSNCQSSCVKAEYSFLNLTSHEVTTHKQAPNDSNLHYIGLIHQCVEYARKWWMLNQGITFGSIDSAFEIIYLTQGKQLNSDATFPLARSINGSATRPPQRGDLLIYAADRAKPKWRHGHVAVVVDVDLKQGIVSLAEENYHNLPWQNKNNFARQIKLLKVSEKYTVIDVNVDEVNAVNKSANAKISGWIYPLPE